MGIAIGMALWLGVAAHCTGAQGGELAGGRIEASLHDATVGRDWLRVRSCAHPEWPPRWLPAPAGVRSQSDSRSGLQPASRPGALAGAAGLDRLLTPDRSPETDTETDIETHMETHTDALPVRAGMPVMLWLDGSARIRLSGIATQSAKLGASVVVRCGSDRLLRGVVRGPGSVELEVTPGWSQP